MAYTSVEAMLYAWFSDQDLWPGKLGIGDVQDLAEKVTAMMMPFRNFYRASAGWNDYDLEACRLEAERAEREL